MSFLPHISLILPTLVSVRYKVLIIWYLSTRRMFTFRYVRVLVWTLNQGPTKQWWRSHLASVLQRIPDPREISFQLGRLLFWENTNRQTIKSVVNHAYAIISQYSQVIIKEESGRDLRATPRQINELYQILSGLWYALSWSTGQGCWRMSTTYFPTHSRRLWRQKKRVHRIMWGKLEVNCLNQFISVFTTVNLSPISHFRCRLAAPFTH